MRRSFQSVLERDFQDEPGSWGRIVYLQDVHRALNTIWHQLLCGLLHVSLGTFQIVSLLLMGDYRQTMTVKAPYADPVGSLLHFLLHKDTAIAELVPRVFHTI